MRQPKPCFRCGEKYFPCHQCRQKSVMAVEIEDDGAAAFQLQNQVVLEVEEVWHEVLFLYKCRHQEVIGDEANENQNIVDEGEVDDIEADDPEEELDAYEALDLAGDDDEASLLSHSCILASYLSLVLF
ncbi:hypothetical protein GH714_020928 [Hevea brasiliensis]|uniref:Uncharacterized protein n=1 Tax=Hevea brasiliensis TaxID=3981 RepID=A0A6A6LDU4_HEVBR|nr:hypothetical protein GH714_020928 [Hevea brasiliensis]